MDSFARDLHLELVARNLTDIVDIIFVSDHGMTDTSHPELVYVDDILGEDGLANIEHEDGMTAALLSISFPFSSIVRQVGHPWAFAFLQNAMRPIT